MASGLNIQTFCLGEWQTNCYLLRVGGSSRGWIVDAGFEPQPLLSHLDAQRIEPALVLLTHAHVDHIAGLADLRARWPLLPILVHAAERDFLADPALNLSAFLAEPVVAPAPTGVLEDGQVLTLDGLAFEVRHTPGHSPGGVTLYCAAACVALAGDALFAGSIGRTDFPTSDHAQLLDSIRRRLLDLPDSIRVLAGHGPPTPIGAERRANPFLRGAG